MHPNRDPPKNCPAGIQGQRREKECLSLPTVTRSCWGWGPRAPPAPASMEGVERREEEKETDGQQWKHKLTRRKRINSRQGADPSTYAVPQPARHRELPRHPCSPGLWMGWGRRGRRSAAGWSEGLKLGMKTPGRSKARAGSLGAAHGRGALWKVKAKSGQSHRGSSHEMEVTPSGGITDLFPMTAGQDWTKERWFLPCWQGQAGWETGFGPGELSSLSFPSQERGAEQQQLLQRAGRCRRSSSSCRSLLRTPAAHGQGTKSIQSRSREAETPKSP